FERNHEQNVATPISNRDSSTSLFSERKRTRSLRPFSSVSNSWSVLSVHAFGPVESPFFRTRGRNSQYEQLSRWLDPALISVAPHYGLHYGFAPATGNFQRLRGRPPLVSPLKSCMRRSFTAISKLPQGQSLLNPRFLPTIRVSLTTSQVLRRPPEVT